MDMAVFSCSPPDSVVSEGGQVTHAQLVWSEPFLHFLFPQLIFPECLNGKYLRALKDASEPSHLRSKCVAHLDVLKAPPHHWLVPLPPEVEDRGDLRSVGFKPQCLL